jgi:hypothetical protein
MKINIIVFYVPYTLPELSITHLSQEILVSVIS